MSVWATEWESVFTCTLAICRSPLWALWVSDTTRRYISICRTVTCLSGFCVNYQVDASLPLSPRMYVREAVRVCRCQEAAPGFIVAGVRGRYAASILASAWLTDDVKSIAPPSPDPLFLESGLYMIALATLCACVHDLFFVWFRYRL